MAEIRLGPGPAFVQLPPRCPLHGEMKPRDTSVNGYTATAWACPGWDGEGCDYEVPPREWAQFAIAGEMVIRLD